MSSLIIKFLRSPRFLVKKLGNGCSRQVFCTPSIPGVVFKQALYPTVWDHNLIEFRYWEKHRDNPDRARFLAPCLEVTDEGSWLAMARTDPIPEYEAWQQFRSLPFWIGDRHADNIGRYEGRVVAHDYAYMNG